MSHLLEPHEQRRFIKWLKTEAKDAENAAKLMERLPPNPMNEEFAKRQKQYAIACQVVAGRLSESESMELR